MIPVLLASPWAGDVERHRAYAIACVRDSIARGEAPLAPHLLYPPALNDDDAGQILAACAADHARAPRTQAARPGGARRLYVAVGRRP